MIPFNRATFHQRDRAFLTQALEGGHASGNGPFTREVEAKLSELHQGSPALLTTSCTHALELSARLLNLGPGDEVIVPSYTFVSSASAFLWNGAKPVFADVSPDTFNIEMRSVEPLVTDHTKAVCIVHYAGVGADPARFADFCADRGLALIEDNAHGLGGAYEGRTLGTFGSMSALSFHETKNVTSGEGGALVLNDAALVERAEILREKGTDRSQFLRGQTQKYTWMDIGSSWVMSDLLAALLLGQLERLQDITGARMRVWATYRESLSEWAQDIGASLPVIPPAAQHTAHMFYMVMPSSQARDQFLEHMRHLGIAVAFHYQSLHSSPMGSSLHPATISAPVSDRASGCLVRLPIYESLNSEDQARVIDAVTSFNMSSS